MGVTVGRREVWLRQDTCCGQRLGGYDSMGLPLSLHFSEGGLTHPQT